MENTIEVNNASTAGLILPREINVIIAQKASQLSLAMLCMVCREFATFTEYNKPYRHHQLNITDKAAKCGYPSIMRLGIELGHPCVPKTLIKAIASENDECVALVRNNIYNYKKVIYAAEKAAEKGRIDIVDSIKAKTTEYLACRIGTVCLMFAAARNGRLDALKLLSERFRPSKWVIEEWCERQRYMLVEAAAMSGDEATLLWTIIEYTDCMTSKTYFNIATAFPRDNVLVVIQSVYTTEITMDVDDPILPADDTLAAAIALGMPDLEGWLYTQGVELGREATAAAAANGWVDVLERCAQYIIETDIDCVINNDQVDSFKFFADHNLLEERHILRALETDHASKIRRYLASTGRIQLNEVCEYAYDTNDLETIKWLHEIGHQLDAPKKCRSSKILAFLVYNYIITVEDALILTAGAYKWRFAAWLEPDPRNWSNAVYHAIATHHTRSLSMYDYACNHGCSDRIDAAFAQVDIDY